MEMEIRIDNKGFSFGDNRFIYSLYYFDSEKYDAPTYGGMFKKVLIECANALQNATREDAPLFIPYAPDDQETECLKLSPLGERLVIERVTVKDRGFNLNIDYLHEFITSPHEILAESGQMLGEFDWQEVIYALTNAEVMND